MYTARVLPELSVGNKMHELGKPPKPFPPEPQSGWTQLLVFSGLKTKYTLFYSAGNQKEQPNFISENLNDICAPSNIPCINIFNG